MFRSIMCADTGYRTYRAVGDKKWTKQRIEEKKLPTPRGIEVSRDNLRQSFESVAQYGLPGVVKPKAGSHGHGVSLNIQSFEDFLEGVEKIKGHAIFEQEIQGKDYRILTIGNKVVAGTLRKPANVVGDGKSSIKELVREKNLLRASNPSLCRNLIPLTDETTRLINAEGHSFEDVPKPGQQVQLARVANIGSGGDSIDVTEFIHEDFINICSQIPKHFGSPEILGIDILAEDISSSPTGQQWTILELNANPDIDIHRWPLVGTPRDAGAALVKQLFPRANLAPLLSFDLSFARKASDKPFFKSLRKRADEFGVSGQGDRTGREYFMHIKGTTAAVNRLTDTLIADPQLDHLKIKESATEFVLDTNGFHLRNSI